MMMRTTAIASAATVKHFATCGTGTEGYEQLPINEETEPELVVKQPWIDFIESTEVQFLMGFFILVNGMVIGLETDFPDAFAWNVFETGLLFVFLLELLFKMVAIGPCQFFNVSNNEIFWNVFDFGIVSSGVAGVILELCFRIRTGSLMTLFRLVRLFRMLRIFKSLRYLKQLWLIAFGFAEAAQAVIWVSVFMIFVLYISSVILTRTTGQPDKEDPCYQFLVANFGSVTRSMLTLFELMAAPDLKRFDEDGDVYRAHPGLLAFLIVFTVFGSFGMIALLTGVISESMFEKNEMRIEEAKMERLDKRNKINEVCYLFFESLDCNDMGEVTRKEIEDGLERFSQCLNAESIDLGFDELHNLPHLMDANHDNSISADEFANAVLRSLEGVKGTAMQEIQYDVSLCKHTLLKLQGTIDALLAHQIASSFSFPRRGGLTDQSDGSPPIPSTEKLEKPADTGEIPFPWRSCRASLPVRLPVSRGFGTQCPSGNVVSVDPPLQPHVTTMEERKPDVVLHDETFAGEREGFGTHCPSGNVVFDDPPLPPHVITMEKRKPDVVFDEGMSPGGREGAYMPVMGPPASTSTPRHVDPKTFAKEILSELEQALLAERRGLYETICERLEESDINVKCRIGGGSGAIVDLKFSQQDLCNSANTKKPCSEVGGNVDVLAARHRTETTRLKSTGPLPDVRFSSRPMSDESPKTLIGSVLQHAEQGTCVDTRRSSTSSLSRPFIGHGHPRDDPPSLAQPMAHADSQYRQPYWNLATSFSNRPPSPVEPELMC